MSQSQPPIPPAGGLRGTPGSPDSPESAPSPDTGEDAQGVVTIQDTAVIDATGSGTSESAGTTDADTPVEPIPPVTDPADDPVVRAAEGEAAGEAGKDDPEQDSADQHDADRLNDPRT